MRLSWPNRLYGKRCRPDVLSCEARPARDPAEAVQPGPSSLLRMLTASRARVGFALSDNDASTWARILLFCTRGGSATGVHITAGTQPKPPQEDCPDQMICDLVELDANALLLAPFDMARAAATIAIYSQRRLLGKPKRTVHFNYGAGLGNVANDGKECWWSQIRSRQQIAPDGGLPHEGVCCRLPWPVKLRRVSSSGSSLPRLPF